MAGVPDGRRHGAGNDGGGGDDMSRTEARHKRLKRLSWAAVEVMHNQPTEQARALYATLDDAYNKAQRLFPDGMQVPEWRRHQTKAGEGR